MMTDTANWSAYTPELMTQRNFGMTYTPVGMTQRNFGMTQRNFGMTYTAEGMTQRNFGMAYTAEEMTQRNFGMTYAAVGMTQQNFGMAYTAVGMAQRNFGMTYTPVVMTDTMEMKAEQLDQLTYMDVLLTYKTVFFTDKLEKARVTVVLVNGNQFIYRNFDIDIAKVEKWESASCQIGNVQVP